MKLSLSKEIRKLLSQTKKIRDFFNCKTKKRRKKLFKKTIYEKSIVCFANETAIYSNIINYFIYDASKLHSEEKHIVTYVDLILDYATSRGFGNYEFGTNEERQERISDLEKYIIEDNEVKDYYRVLIFAYGCTKNDKKVKKLYKECLKEGKENEDFFNELMYIYAYKLEDFDELISIGEYIINNAKEYISPRLYYYLSYGYFRMLSDNNYKLTTDIREKYTKKAIYFGEKAVDCGIANIYIYTKLFNYYNKNKMLRELFLLLQDL